MKRLLIYTFAALLFCSSSMAQEASNSAKKDIIINEKNGELYIEKSTVAELEKLFSAVKYDDYIFMPNMYYPAIFLQKLPDDYADIKDESYRNRLFIKMMAPIAIKVNEDIFAERLKIFAMAEEFRKTKELTEEQSKQFEDWAVKYDIFTPFKGYRRTLFIFDELKKKADVIPQAMLIGAAAIESNWGTSRPALKANNLYKLKVWYGEEKGIPSLEDKDDDYEFKIFDSLYDSMVEYAMKVNSGIDFEYIRAYRSEYRRRQRTVSGRTLAHAMMMSSQLKNFAGLLDYTITFYEMDNLDYAKLMRLPDDAKN